VCVVKRKKETVCERVCVRESERQILRMCTAVFVVNLAALVLTYSRAPIKTVCVDVCVREDACACV